VGDTAAVKLQMRLNYRTGRMCDVVLCPGREHDARAVSALSPIPAGSLQLQDLAYFKLDTFQAESESGRSLTYPLSWANTIKWCVA
jgi:hypothetical protein